VRLCSKSREAVSSGVEFLTLHNQVRSLDIEEYNKLQKYYAILDETGELQPKDEKEFKQLREDAEYDILETADVICATCITSGDQRLRGRWSVLIERLQISACLDR
jgi:regulator of nonsense transcripts 1